MDAEAILKNFEYLKDERKRFEAIWQDCEKKVAPVLREWEDEKPDAPYTIPKRITNKPTNYLNTCITGIAGYAMSPNIKWFKLSLQDPRLLEVSGVAQWLESCERILRRVFERCGLYRLGLHWLELSAIYGQSVILIEETHNSDAPLRYFVPEMHELFLDDDETGNTENVYRCYWSNIENVVNHYGIKAMHENIRKRVEEYQNNKGHAPGADMNMKLLHAVYLRRTGKPDYGEVAQNKKWASVVIDVANKHIIKESGYDDFPYAVFFWEKAGKPYGISPTMKAINDIAIYQQAYATLMTVAEYSANPAKNVPETLRGRENFQPGGFNYFRNPEQMASQIDVGTNYPITVQFVETLTQSIKEWYNVDFFLMLRQQTGLQNMTATAVAAMQGEQVALLAALVSNLYSGLDKVIQRTFDILAKKQLLPPMPPALKMMGGALKTDYLGVLAQAQKAAYEFMGVTDVLDISARFAQLAEAVPEYGEALSWIKPDVVYKKAIESRGAPMELLRTQEEHDALTREKQQREMAMMQMQAAAQQNQAILQNAQNLNTRVEPNSMLQGILGGGRR